MKTSYTKCSLQAVSMAFVAGQRRLFVLHVRKMKTKSSRMLLFFCALQWVWVRQWMPPAIQHHLHQQLSSCASSMKGRAKLCWRTFQA
jgi:hypothetical protein